VCGRGRGDEARRHTPRRTRNRPSPLAFFFSPHPKSGAFFVPLVPFLHFFVKIRIFLCKTFAELNFMFTFVVQSRGGRLEGKGHTKRFLHRICIRNPLCFFLPHYARAKWNPFLPRGNSCNRHSYRENGQDRGNVSHPALGQSDGYTVLP
jgi:hypothetical protein